MLQMSPGWNRAVLSKGKLSLLHRATPARKRKSTRVIGRRGSSITEDEAAEEVIHRATSNTDNHICTLVYTFMYQNTSWR